MSKAGNYRIIKIIRIAKTKTVPQNKYDKSLVKSRFPLEVLFSLSKAFLPLQQHLVSLFAEVPLAPQAPDTNGFRSSL